MVSYSVAMFASKRMFWMFLVRIHKQIVFSFSPRERDMSMLMVWFDVLMLTATKLLYQYIYHTIWTTKQRNYYYLSSFDWEFFSKKQSQKNPLNTDSTEACSLKIENKQMNWNIKIEFESKNLLRLLSGKCFLEKMKMRRCHFHCLLFSSLYDRSKHQRLSALLFYYMCHHLQCWTFFNFHHLLYDSPRSDCYRI